MWSGNNPRISIPYPADANKTINAALKAVLMPSWTRLRGLRGIVLVIRPAFIFALG
jgi:hypothetical protein